MKTQGAAERVAESAVRFRYRPHRVLRLVLLSLALVVLLHGMAHPLSAAESMSKGPSTPQEMEAWFGRTLMQQMEQEHIVGATVAVVKDGELFFAQGYGYADREKQIPVVADRTLFYIGSDGKLFTWTAVMQLVEQGKIDLHADIQTYLDFPIPATFDQPITMHHLMTHSAGFEEQLAALMVAGPDELLPLRDFLLYNLPERIYPPGTLFAYSNYGTALAGYIVERISGEPYEQYITNHILKPLAMHNSASVQPLPRELMANAAKGYRYRNGRYVPVEFEWTAAAPAGVVRATATDMAKFMIAHLNHGSYDGASILQAETCEAMHQPQFRHDPRLTGLTYGFVESRENNQEIIWHMGESAHFITVLALLPKENVGLFVSYNSPADGRKILSAFLDHYYPVTTAAPVPTLPDAALHIKEMQGTYVPTRVAQSSAQKLAGWAGAIQVQPGADNTLHVGPMRFHEIEPGLFREVDGERLLTYRSDAQTGQTYLFYGPFAFFKVPWYQTFRVQMFLAAFFLLILLSAVLLWLGSLVVRWRQGKHTPVPQARWARRIAVAFGVFNWVLFGWFLLMMLGYAESYVFPVATVEWLTWLWWLNVPAAALLVAGALLAWKNRYWRLAGRIHYTLVTVAAIGFVWFLASWNLLA